MRVILFLAVLMVFAYEPATAQSSPMKFFVTSSVGPDPTGPRGIRGADEHCAQLGYSAGFGDFEWRAYLNAPAAAGQPAVRAKDRIGTGPWFNFHGTLIAQTVADLVGTTNNLGRETTLNERGDPAYGAANAPDPRALIATPGLDPNGRYLCFAR